MIDTATNTVTTAFSVGDSPYGLAVAPDGAHVYAANSGDDNVSVIDTATNAVTATIAVGAFPYAVAFATPGAAPSTDLSVTVADSADPVSKGGTFTYTATITNNGPDAATGVSLSTTLSGTARTIISAAASQGSCAITAPTITCPLGALANSASATVTITVKPTATGTLTATSTVTGTETDPTPANNTDAENTTVNTPPAADIDVNLTAQPHLGILAPYLTYTLTAHNTGPNAVTSATLTATLPPGDDRHQPVNRMHQHRRLGHLHLRQPSPTAPARVRPSGLPLRLLSLGQVTVTGTRTTSAPADPNPANDNASATCTVISVLLATCP